MKEICLVKVFKWLGGGVGAVQAIAKLTCAALVKWASKVLSTSMLLRVSTFTLLTKAVATSNNASARTKHKRAPPANEDDGPPCMLCNRTSRNWLHIDDVNPELMVMFCGKKVCLGKGKIGRVKNSKTNTC